MLKFDASSLPVCLVTLKGEGLNETQLRDLAQFQVRNQIASVPGASVPQPFGGKYRQIMVYADPYKLEAHQLSPMDVVRARQRRQPDPARRRRADRAARLQHLHQQPAPRASPRSTSFRSRRSGTSPVRVADIGDAKDAQQIQTNIVRVDGQRSRLPAGAEAGRRHQHHRGGGRHQGRRRASCSTSRSSWSPQVVFDQSRVRQDRHRDAAARRRASACS